MRLKFQEPRGRLLPCCRLVWIVAFLCTIFLGVEIGIGASPWLGKLGTSLRWCSSLRYLTPGTPALRAGIAVGLSLVVVVYKTAFPRIATLGRLPGTDVYRNIKMYENAKAPAGMLLLRIDAPIFFANVETIKDFVRSRVAKSKREDTDSMIHIQYVILDLSPVTDIDATGIHFLNDFIDELREQGIRFAMANPSKQVLQALSRAGLVAKIGAGFMHVNMADAVADAQAALEAANLSSQL